MREKAGLRGSRACGRASGLTTFCPSPPGPGSTRGERRLGGRKLLAFDDEVDLRLVQGLALQQGGRHAVHDVRVVLEDLVGRVVAGVDEGANRHVDLLGGVVGVVAGLGDVAAQEDSPAPSCRRSGPRSLMPYSQTILRASSVARTMSLPAPVVLRA